MKKAKLLLVSYLFALGIIAQTTSTNFEVTDCDGQSYNLYDDLDNGNVVVIAWVMPCVSCIQHPLETYQIVQQYDQEKVKFLMVDDYADHDCSDIQTWSENYQMGNCTKFVNTAITMSDYGVDGMPKIVVTGCKSHKVFFNKNSSSTGVKAAIDEAIAECNSTSVSESLELSSQLNLFPNPARQKIYVSIDDQSNLLSITIRNLLGLEVFKLEHHNPSNPIDISSLAEGIYVTHIISDNRIYNNPFVVKK
jgi:hypothetical protein